MAATPLDVQQRGVDVGVAVLLQTSDERVLLTRRAKELHIFPNLWVPPGLMSPSLNGVDAPWESKQWSSALH